MSNFSDDFAAVGMPDLMTELGETVSYTFENGTVRAGLSAYRHRQHTERDDDRNFQLVQTSVIQLEFHHNKTTGVLLKEIGIGDFVIVTSDATLVNANGQPLKWDYDEVVDTNNTAFIRIQFRNDEIKRHGHRAVR